MKLRRNVVSGIMLVVLVLVVGCSTEKDQLVRVVREGRALLRHPAPGDLDWEVNRATFLADSELVAPSTTATLAAAEAK